MVFGLINTPHGFSRLMQRILHPLKNNVAMWYLDDILVPATSFEDMLNRLRRVLEVLKEAKLTQKLSKCHFGYKEVVYRGFMLSTDGVRLGEQKVQAVQQFHTPSTNKKRDVFSDYTGFSENLFLDMQKLPCQLVTY